MLRGIYTAAAGMVSEGLCNDAIANNLANVNTTGYKRDVTVTKDFATFLIERTGKDGSGAAPIGGMGYGDVVNEIATIYTNGQLQPTGNPLDLAVQGSGYFAVQTPNGVRYTRDGAFFRSGRGQLVTADGYQVLGTNNRPITLPDGTASISSDGRVTVAGQPTGQLQLVEFGNDRSVLRKEGSNLFSTTNEAQPRRATGTVQQGSLERSNVNVISEMVNMISGYRSYEMSGKMVQSQDSLLDKAVNEVGRV